MRLFEVIAHPWAALKAIQGLDRLPDRRVSRASTRSSVDPIRRHGDASAIYKTIGLHALDENRVELYANFQEMDSDPMIATVLDAYGDDAGQFDPERKRIVWVEADNKEIEQILTRTLDRVKLDELAFPILRSLARDGDAFEHVALARGQGVVALRSYEPWTVARVEDDIGRLVGFAPANESGEATDIGGSAVRFDQALHFRLQSRNRSKPYGATSSFLWGSRIIWRELQLMEDQIVVQRLMRRPDRLMVMLDSSGMSHDEAWQTLKEWETRFHREVYLNPTSGDFRSQGLPLDAAKDLILPRGPNNATEIQNFPATNQNDLLRDLDHILNRLAAGIGFPIGFLGRGESGAYQPGQSLSRQYHPFAKRATRLQRAFLTEATRMCLIDLVYKGLDPQLPRNAFTLHMASVAPIVEIERAEIIQLRMDRMQLAVQFGEAAQLDMSIWIPYVLEKYGGLPKDLIKALRSNGDLGERQGHKNIAEVLRDVSAPVDNVWVHSDSVTIDGGVNRNLYTPTSINESTGRGEPAAALQSFDAALGKTLSERATLKFCDNRRERMITRMRLVTTLAGLPLENADLPVYCEEV